MNDLKTTPLLSAYLAFSFFIFLSCGKPDEPEFVPPNIIYILADDLGYGDISSFNLGSKIKTDHIDALAAKGMSFTDAHSNSAVCTPTRYGILTGRYAFRSPMKKGVTWSYDAPIIAPERMTVASYLKNKGYETACIGKWHLGLDWQKDQQGNLLFHEPVQNGPNALGFDYFFGIAASLDIPPYFYIENDRITAHEIDTIADSPLPEFWREGPIGNDFEHIEVLPKITEKAVDFIQQKANQEAPFFLYFPLPAPHTPILPTEAFEGKSDLTAYGDFTLMVDDVVGQISKVVEDLGIADNTIIVFTSDNGFAPYAGIEEHEGQGHFPSYHFRGYKADLYEGGHRIPFIFTWPDKVKGGEVSAEIICLTDFLSTCAAIFGESLPDNAGEDSYNLLPVLVGDLQDQPLREATVHHSVHGAFSIRKDQWKLIFSPGSGGWSYPNPKETEEGDFPPIQLYNMLRDNAEITNLYEDHPEVVADLTRLMERYIQEGRSTPGAAQPNEGEEIDWKGPNPEILTR